MATQEFTPLTADQIATISRRIQTAACKVGNVHDILAAVHPDDEIGHSTAVCMRALTKEIFRELDIADMLLQRLPAPDMGRFLAFEDEDDVVPVVGEGVQS